MRIRIPKPKLETCTTTYGAAYCWICEHKTLGIRVHGNTPKEAIKFFREDLRDELIFAHKLKPKESLEILG